MYAILTILEAILSSILFSLLAVFIISYKSWLDFFRPDWFYIFNIYSKDMLTFKEHKFFLPFSGKSNSYVIGKSRYDCTEFKPYINSKGVYTWNFIDSNMLPISFKQSGLIDGKLFAEAKKITLDNIWFGNNGIEDFIKTYGLIIISIVILVLFAYLITQNQQTTRLLLNVTSRLR